VAAASAAAATAFDYRRFGMRAANSALDVVKDLASAANAAIRPLVRPAGQQVEIFIPLSGQSRSQWSRRRSSRLCHSFRSSPLTATHAELWWQ
jgi:hypothetical protein